MAAILPLPYLLHYSHFLSRLFVIYFFTVLFLCKNILQIILIKNVINKQKKLLTSKCIGMWWGGGKFTTFQFVVLKKVDTHAAKQEILNLVKLTVFHIHQNIKNPVHWEIKAQINRTQFYKSSSKQCVLSKKSSHEGGTHNILQGQSLQAQPSSFSVVTY